MPLTPESPLLAVTRSGRPSALRSAAVTSYGRRKALNGLGPVKLGASAPAAVVFVSTVFPPAPLVLALAVTSSGRPSPLRSAAVTAFANDPVANGVGPLNVGGAAAPELHESQRQHGAQDGDMTH